MERYMNLGGDSNVRQYEIGDNYIIVGFADSKCYKYTYASAGSYNIEQMKTLAQRGQGLNSFIMHNVKTRYESKW